MAEWEYCILTAVETTEQTQFMLAHQDGKGQKVNAKTRLEVFAELGRKGWELVAVQPLGVGIREFYFKRAGR